MHSSFISTLTLNNSPRAALPRLQSELAKASQELTTGRRADIGRDLGVGIGENLTLRRDQTSLQSLIDGNAATEASLDRTQTALDDIRGQADSFLAAMVGISDANSGARVLGAQGRAALDALTSTLNLTDGRRYLFGGLNSGTKPMNGFDEGPQAALAGAFATRFGLDPADPWKDPAVAQISATDLADFIDTTLAAAFEEPGWSATWSDADSENRSAAISTTARVEVGANANEPAMRKLAMAYTMMATLGGTDIKGDALNMVLDRTRSLLGSAISGVTDISTRIGSAQSRIAAADTLMRGAIDATDRRLNALEGIDPAEAKTRFDTMTTQIEMSYSLTSRILKLSIMDYV
ncbi:flagellar hook-associated family protein [Ancylobacter sp. IITR112]|uniref:flagellar hook-associated family protein n=1 Tax=Ancylobacter sp. IITR112 TaxID=3138073 RepID=UPI00352A3895